MRNPNILAINFNHDGSAAIVSNGRLAAFVNTERFSKKKKQPGIREADLDAVLAQAKLDLSDIGIVLLCNLNDMDSPDIPFLFGSSLKETWLEFWVNQAFDKVRIRGIQFPCLVNPDHHLLHCSLAYQTSPFEEAICFSWDPTGYGVFIGRKNKLSRQQYQLKPYNSCEWYSKVATFLFGTGLVGAGKVMGLAPYGIAKSNANIPYAKIRTLGELYFYSKNERSIYLDEKGKKLNVTAAFNIQHLMEMQLEDVLTDLYDLAVQEKIAPNICIAGGGALNSVANQLGFAGSGFERLHIHPASGDDGTAIGAALWYWYDHLDHPKGIFSNRDIMYSVASYDQALDEVLGQGQYKEKLRVEKTEDFIGRTASYLAEGKIIGWFQGSSEVGPRALGNRSILADPRNPEMKDILNKKVKFREAFRPFAPSVLNEHAEEWFGMKDSPFMLRVCNVLKGDIPAVTHVDGTARIQTIVAVDNPNYYRLVDSFYRLTGVPVLLNTSFNIKGGPIVETPKDAIDCFLETEMDVLVFENRIILKVNASAPVTEIEEETATSIVSA